MAILDRLRRTWHAWRAPQAPMDVDSLTLAEFIASEQNTLQGNTRDPAQEDRRQTPRANARQGTRVLIIDDSATVVAVLAKMLRQNGYNTLEALSAEAGLEMARNQPPDLVFLDIVLPGMDGFAALRALRHDAGTKSVPVIMISGNIQATEQFYAQRIGADDFMKKPFTRSEVFARIESLLDDDFIPKRMGKQPALALASMPAQSPT